MVAKLSYVTCGHPIVSARLKAQELVSYVIVLNPVEPSLSARARGVGHVVAVSAGKLTLPPGRTAMPRRPLETTRFVSICAIRQHDTGQFGMALTAQLRGKIDELIAADESRNPCCQRAAWHFANLTQARLDPENANLIDAKRYERAR